LPAARLASAAATWSTGVGEVGENEVVALRDGVRETAASGRMLGVSAFAERRGELLAMAVAVLADGASSDGCARLAVASELSLRATVDADGRG